MENRTSIKTHAKRVNEILSKTRSNPRTTKVAGKLISATRIDLRLSNIRMTEAINRLTAEIKKARSDWISEKRALIAARAARVVVPILSQEDEQAQKDQLRINTPIPEPYTALGYVPNMTLPTPSNDQERLIVDTALIINKFYKEDVINKFRYDFPGRSIYKSIVDATTTMPRMISDKSINEIIRFYEIFGVFREFKIGHVLLDQPHSSALSTIKIVTYHSDPKYNLKVIKLMLDEHETALRGKVIRITTMIYPDTTKTSLGLSVDDARSANMIPLKIVTGAPTLYNKKEIAGKILRLTGTISGSAEWISNLMYINIYSSGSPRKADDFTLWDGKDLNCVLKAINRKCPKKTEVIKKFAKKHFNDFKISCDKTMIRKIHKALRVRVVVKTIFGDTWFDSDPDNKNRYVCVKVLGHEDHASEYSPIADFSSVVHYVDSVDEKIAELIETKVAFEIVTKEEMIGNHIDHKNMAVKCGLTIFKHKFDMDEEDYENEEYFNCTDAGQYRYKKFKNTNKLNVLKGVYFDITRESDCHMTCQMLSEYEINKTKAYSYDMNKAFPSFRTSPLFDRFKFAVGYFDLRKTTAPLMDVISKPGFSRVNDIEYIGAPGDFIEKVKHIVDQHWYSNIRLYNAVTKGYIKLEVKLTVLCNKSEDLDFPFTTEKRFNNSFIGRLTSGASDSTFFKTYVCKKEEERNHLLSCFEDSHNNAGPAIVDEKTGYIKLPYASLGKSNQKHQIHTCIIDYQQTTFINKMIECLDYDVITYNTDGFYTRREVPKSIIEHSLIPGEFKREGFQAIQWQSKEERTLKSFNDFILPHAPEHNGEKMSNLMLFTGPAGCGKSYKHIFDQPRINCSFAFPTHKLVSDCKRKIQKERKIYVPGDEFGLTFTMGNSSTSYTEVSQGVSYTIDTFHKLCEITKGAKKKKSGAISLNIVVDEVSLISKQYMEGIMKYCDSIRANLIAIGDINHDGSSHQRGTVGDQMGKELLEKFIHVEWKNEDTPQEFRRQSDADHWDFIQQLRTKSWDLQLTDVYSKCKNITTEQLVNKWDNNWIGISSRHTNVTMYNRLIRDKQQELSLETCRARTTRTTKNKEGEYKSINGQLTTQLIKDVSFERMSSTDETSSLYEAAYFVTSDMIQGTSLDEIIVIDPESMLDGFLYTAISRCRNLDNVYIINEFSD